MRRAPSPSTAATAAVPDHAASLPPLLGPSKSLAIAAGVYLVAILIVFGDLLVAGGDRILSLPVGDTFTVFVGWFEFTFGQMYHGNLPLWNPHLFSGAPCLGGFQEALLYPPAWLHLIMPLPQAINYGIALHVFLAGLFTYMWMVRRGVHPAAAILSGLIFMFGGGYFMHIAPGHIPNLQTMVWAPLIFLAIDDLTTTRSLRGAWLGSGAVAMMILAGHPQYVYYTALVSGVYAIFGIMNAPSRLRSLGGLTMMAVGGAALSAMQLFTGLQAAGESLRSQLDFKVASSFPFPPENLLTTILPGFFGDISSNSYWGRWLIWEDSLFIGAVAMFLVIYGMARGDKSQRRFTILAFALGCVLISLGSATPVYWLLFKYLPAFNSFRGVSKFAFLASLFLANLAGVGFDRVLRDSTWSRRPAMFSLAAALVMVIGASFFWTSGDGGAGGYWGHVISHINWSAEAYQHGGVARSTPGGEFVWKSAHKIAIELIWCASVTAAIAGWWFAMRKDRRFVYGIALLAAVELLVFAWHNRPWFNLADIAKQENSMRERLRLAREIEGNQRQRGGDIDPNPPELRVITNDPSVVLGVNEFEAWGNDPMVLKRYAQFMALSQSPPPELGSPLPVWGMVRVVLAQRPDNHRWIHLPFPLMKRAELIEDVRVIDDSKNMLFSLADAKFNSHRTVLLEKPISPMPAPPPGVTDAPGVVEVKDLPGETDEIEVTADVRRPCVLVISDNYSTGWHTLPLPDAPARNYEVIPADYTLRGIPLVPGTHHFILEYRPKAYVIGKWVTVVALVFWIGAGVMLSGWVKRKAAEETKRRPNRRAK